MLDDEISDIIEKLDVNTTTLELRCRFYEKPHDFEKKKRIKIISKKTNQKKLNRKIKRRSRK